MRELILSDVQMPNLDGLELATLVTSRTPPIPIVLMSADSVPGDYALPFLRKPFEVEDLLTLLARMLPVFAVATVALTGPDVV